MVSRFILKLNDKDYEKFREICDLIPEKNIPREKRVALNKTIRDELPNVSNKVVCRLAFNVKHQLSLKELRRRFREKEFNDLKELFWLVELVYEIKNTTDNEYYKMVRKEIKRITPSYNLEEIVEIVRSHIDYDGFVNRMPFLEFMTFCSPHKEEIIQKMRGIRGFDRMILEKIEKSNPVSS